MLRALERAPTLGFRKYVISATTPFTRDDLAALRSDAPGIVARKFPASAPWGGTSSSTRWARPP